MHYQRWWTHGDPETKLNNRNTRPLDRFMDKIIKDRSGCWLWTANVNPRGYAMFYDGNKGGSAHRWIFQYVNEVELSPEQHIDHVPRS